MIKSTNSGVFVSQTFTMMMNSSYKLLSLLFGALCFKLTLTIVIPQPRIERIEDPSNRDLIDITAEFNFEHVRNLKHTLTCLKNFVDIYLDDQPTSIVVMTMEDSDVDVFQAYLSAIQEYRGTFILSHDLEQNSLHKSSLSALIITSNYEEINESTVNLIELCSNSCSYAVVLTDIFETSEIFLEAAKSSVAVLWEKKVANAAILGTVGSRLLAAKSRDYVPGILRTPSPPELVDECHESRNWNIKKDIFEPLSMDNSIIRIAYFDREPYVAVEEETEIFWGLEVWILNTTTIKLDFDLEPCEIKWGNDTTTTVEDEIKEMLNSDKVIDMVAGGILWDPDEGMDFTTPYDVVQVVWLVPMYSNISLRGLITPLDDMVWYAVCGLFLFGLLLKLFLFKDLTLLEMLALVTGYAWYKQPVTMSSRLLFISWVIFGYILCQFYLASLAGQLMAQADLQIETMADLVNSGLKLGGTKTHKIMFGHAEDDETDEDKASDNILHIISSEFIVFSQDNYEHQLQELMDGHNTSVALAVTLNVSSMGTGFNQDNVHILGEVLASYPLAFAVWRGLPYLSQINSVLVRLIQSGVINIYGVRAARKSNLMHHYNQDDRGGSNTLQLDDIAPGFLLLVIGYLASGLCLLGEIVVMKLTEFKTQKMKKKKKKKKKEEERTEKIVKKKKQPKGILRNTEKKTAQTVIKPNVKFGYYTRINHYQ